MIYCVWYPSGGFGHFINGILTLYGKKFKRPNNNIKFSLTGDSHSLDLVAPKYTATTTNYNYEFDLNYNYSVLVDLGINSDNSNFMLAFSKAKIIKMCYTDTSWPVVAMTMINKAMKSTIESEVPVDSVLWNSNEAWARREKYFLFLRDHHLRNAWPIETDSNIKCITIDLLVNYIKLKDALEDAGPELSNFEDIWNKWYLHNKKYFVPILQAKQVLEKIKNSEDFDLTNFTDVWTQAVIYYFIWLEWDKEVPHNDFANFFSNTSQITKWIQQ